MRIREAVARTLDQRGHAVRSSSAALPGLQSAIDDPPDVVVLDLGLPDLDGRRALEMLRAVQERHQGEPIDRLARAALDETPLRLAMAASYGGGQRAANVDKAARHIAELARDGMLSPSEIMDRILEEDAQFANRGDSPLADEGVNAVRVLTIHMAKGLEWDMVIVPDLAASTGGWHGSDEESGCGVVGGPGRGPPALALRMGRVQTPAYAEHARVEKIEKAAELKRLLYVAATRARERLVLVVGPPSRGAGIWIPPLAAWGYEIEDGFPPAGPLHGGCVEHERRPDPGTRRPGRGAEEPEPSIIEAARLCATACRSAASAARPFGSPSGLVEKEEEDDLEDEETAARKLKITGRKGKAVRKREVAQAAGEAAHRLLEAWDGRDPAWLEAKAAAAARACSRPGLDPAEVEAHLLGVLRRARASGVLDAIGREPDLAREVPVLLVGKDGRLYRGTVDRVCGTPEEPTVVDFKTDADVDELFYAPQLAIYGEALQKAMGLADPPEGEIVRLGGG
jgi:ATP-dependent exoDNAse (exonuclease V) beta subunit